ncbi:MAG: hypothetical protein H7246_19240 [Phycisphaerae bacterium]|nr:hypothetical protein [Saprospiraceae bacterium]
MTILGNIFLALATLFFLLFGITVIGKEPPRGGDAVMGYTWGIIIFNLLFLGCMTVVAIAIGSKGGFDWVSPSKGTRFLIVAAGLLAAVITAALSALFKGEPGATAAVFKIFSGFAPVLVPLVLIVSAAILLNDGLRMGVPMAAYKIPLMVVFGLGMLGVGAGIIGWVIESNQNSVRRLEGMQADQDRYHQDHMNSIETCDVTKNMSQILVYTDANHDADVREKAVAKIKTNPGWQQELVRLLENKGALEVFNFLASNDVDDKTLFLAPVNTGVLSLADWIRRQIREASEAHHFYEDQFSWEVERMLRAVDKFEGMGTDYRPAVREVRAAFEEPSEMKKPKFNCISTLDNWIKKHQ